MFVFNLLELIHLIECHWERVRQHYPGDGLCASGRGQGASVCEICVHTGHQIVHGQAIRHMGGHIHLCIALHIVQALDDAADGIIGRIGHMIEHADHRDAILEVGCHSDVGIDLVAVHNVHLQWIAYVVYSMLRPPMHMDLLHNKVVGQAAAAQRQIVSEARELNCKSN